MIVPRSRLLFWVAAVVLPFALIGAVSPPAAGVSLLCIGGLLAGRAGRRLRRTAEAWRASAWNFPPSRACPRTARQNWNCASATNGSAAPDLRVALAWPREIQTASENHGRPSARAKRMVAADLALHPAQARQLPV